MGFVATSSDRLCDGPGSHTVSVALMAVPNGCQQRVWSTIFLFMEVAFEG